MKILDGFNSTDSGGDMADVGRHSECQSASLQAEAGAGDKQQVRLHGLQEATVVDNAQLRA